jgi:uncharacterized membrane protein
VRLPVAVCGAVLLMTGLAYHTLTRVLVARHGKDSVLVQALGRDSKAMISLFTYAAAILIAFWNGWAACVLCALIAIAWFVPDARIERCVRRSASCTMRAEP